MSESLCIRWELILTCFLSLLYWKADGREPLHTCGVHIDICSITSLLEGRWARAFAYVRSTYWHVFYHFFMGRQMDESHCIRVEYILTRFLSLLYGKADGREPLHTCGVHIDTFYIIFFLRAMCPTSLGLKETWINTLSQR